MSTYQSITSPPVERKFNDMRDYRAPSLLQPHRLREAIRDAHEGRIPPLVNYFHMLANPQMLKVVCQLGYDTILIDMEHASMDIEMMQNMIHDIQFMSEGKSHAIVRVSGHSHEAIGYAMDAGASLLIPQVNNVEEAKHILASTKFGSKIGGTRSAPPARYIPGVNDSLIDPTAPLWENLNRQAAVMFQFESASAVLNLDSILSEIGDQIDACFIGFLDVRASMGLDGPFGTEPEYLEIVQLFRATCEKWNMPISGAAPGPREQKEGMGRGCAMVTPSMDVLHIFAEGVRELRLTREIFGKRDLTTEKAVVGNGTV